MKLFTSLSFQLSFFHPGYGNEPDGALRVFEDEASSFSIYYRSDQSAIGLRNPSLGWSAVVAC